MQSAQFRVHRGSCDLVWVFGEPRLVCKCMVGYTLHRQTDTSTPTAGYRKKIVESKEEKKSIFAHCKYSRTQGQHVDWSIRFSARASWLARAPPSVCLVAHSVILLPMCGSVDILPTTGEILFRIAQVPNRLLLLFALMLRTKMCVCAYGMPAYG